MMHRLVRLLTVWSAVVVVASTACGNPLPQEIPIIRTQGSYQEMGYQLGLQTASGVMYLVENYFFRLFDPGVYETVVVPYFRQRFIVPDEFSTEISGMLAGMRDSGVDLYVDAIGRDLEEIDIQIANAVTDINLSLSDGLPLSCASASAWGNATLGDAVVQGEMIHARNLDWFDTINHVLARSTILVARTPSEPGTQPWVSVTFPGLIGCLSGMNEAGVAINLNMGNHAALPSQNQLVPIMLAMRQGIEQADVNGDGRSTLEDVGAALDEQRLAFTFLIHAAQPVAAVSPDYPAATFEVDLEQRAVRVPADDPDLAPWFHVTTNHHRKLYPPTGCWRYAAIKNAIRTDYRADREEVWSYLVASRQSTTCQSMLFLPAARELWLSFTDAQGYAPDKAPAMFTWSQLFSDATPTPGESSTPSPTPTPIAPTATPIPPTHTPVPPSPTPLPPTNTPFPPTETPLPPTPTAVPSGLSVSVRTSKTTYIPNDQFQAFLSFINGPAPVEVLQAIVLDVWGQYWFAPAWTQAPEVEAKLLPVTSGTEIEFLSFAWPAGAGTFDGIKFWAAFLDPATWSLMSNVADCEWGAAESD